jgi:hypothetical protein
MVATHLAQTARRAEPGRPPGPQPGACAAGRGGAALI